MDKRRSKGFTLLELLAVLIIISLLSLIAIPLFANKNYDAKVEAHKNSVELLMKQAQTYLYNGGVTLPIDSDDDFMGTLVTRGYLRERTKNPFTGEEYVITVAANGIVKVTPGTDEYPTREEASNSSGEEAPTEEEEVIPEPHHETTIPIGYVGIYSIEDLYEVRNNLSGKYILMKNLDFTQDSSYENPTGTTITYQNSIVISNPNGDGTTDNLKTEFTAGAGWLPIGTNTTPFIGIFNGNNYKITGLFINRNTTYQGFFGYINTGSQINNLGLENVSITGTQYIGSFVGYKNAGSIDSCYSTGAVNGTNVYVGGLVGYDTIGMISNSYSTANITASNGYAGGIVGRISSGAINNCYAAGNVSVASNSYAGGLVGYQSNGTISNSFAVGNVTGVQYVGGLLGQKSTTGTGTITNSYRLDTQTINYTSSLGTYGVAEDQYSLQSLNFLAFTLHWDFNTIWTHVVDGYPILGGEGKTPVLNYQIYKVEDLMNIEADLTGTYTLMNDIDFNNNSNYKRLANKTQQTTGTGWYPIGVDNSRPFTGTLNGNGHVIKNLFINRPSTNYQGLFGYVNTGSQIKNLGLENVNVTGAQHSAGLVGLQAAGVVDSCYSTGVVNGTNNYAGGLIGYNSTGTISNSYSTANVTGTTFTGGILGYLSSGTITNCYATGNIVGTTNNIGGLVGYQTGGGISNSFAVGNVTGAQYVGGLIGQKSTTGTGTITNSYRLDGQIITYTSNLGSYGVAEDQYSLQSLNFLAFILHWDFNTVWTHVVGCYPTLGAGGITPTVNYQIYTVEDLMNIESDLTGTYTLMNDIDFNSDSSYERVVNKAQQTTGTGWYPIGVDNSRPFTGTLNGNGHVIKNLFINRPSTNYQGLFGYVNTGSQIKNLGLENVNVTGSQHTGGLVGIQVAGVIDSCYSTGVVNGTNNYAGGLVGYDTTGTISNSYSTANVTGTIFTGGILGYLSSGTITNCYATGNVVGTTNNIGGLVGYQSGGGISNSFAVGNVTGVQYVGGLLGQKSTTGSGVITNSYRLDTQTINYTSNLGTYGVAEDLYSLQSLNFLAFILHWDFNTVWTHVVGGYPTLGAGGITPNVNYQIYTVEDLMNIESDLAGTYTLMNDIDFNSDSSYERVVNKAQQTTGTGWYPIGTDSNRTFTGTFNGNGHVIKNLFINRPSTNYQGLFGYVNTGSQIKNLGLENVNVTGALHTGGLVGIQGAGVIDSCYSTGVVNGTNNYAGGLVGYGTTGTISNSYSTANVTGATFTGGILGYLSSGTITNCYATGNIIGTASNIGGLVGYQSSGSINNSFAVGNVTGVQYVGGLLGQKSSTGSGVMTNNYRLDGQIITYTSNLGGYGVAEDLYSLQSLNFLAFVLDWDFNTVWTHVVGGYPTLGAGGITPSISYQIYTVEDLMDIEADLTGTYTLMNDIDFNDNSCYERLADKVQQTTGTGWYPIGTDSNRTFTGTLNGNGHVIKNLFINRPSTNYQGLFGYVNTGSQINNLGLQNVNITGGMYTGGLAGYERGTVNSCYVTGTVNGSSFVGGFAGYLSTGTISNNYSTANVTSTTYTGGVIGYLSSGTITNCYATGNITSSSDSAGGLVGYQSSGSINNSFAVGNVTGVQYVGGLLGQKSSTGSGVMTNNYRLDGQIITYTSNLGGYGVAEDLYSLQSLNFLAFVLDWDFNTVWTHVVGGYPTLGAGGITPSISYQIYTVEDLMDIEVDLTGTYTLMNDIDFNSDSNYERLADKIQQTTGTGWYPIGPDSIRTFTGTFNGNGHVIKNLFINRPSTNYQGLFGYLNTGSQINNLGFQNVNVTGLMYNGGLVGYNRGSINGCYVTGNVSGSSFTGGLIGFNSTGTISNSYSTVNVTGGETLGGLLGSLGSGTLSNCYATGNITSSSNSAGGLIGYQINGTISNSYATGNVTGVQYVGGLLGEKYTSGTGTIINSYRLSTQTITYTSYLGSYGTAETQTNLQNLTPQTGSLAWDTTTIWQLVSGSWPVLR